MEKEGEGEGEGEGERGKGKGERALVFPCVFASLHLCVYFFTAFPSSPRFISICGLKTIDHAVNPILDEPLAKIDHQSESQVS
jgi:hypothetical protein